MHNRLYVLKRDLGKGKSNYQIASSALFSVILFFYVLNLTSYFQPIVYPLVDRITYPMFFDNHFFNSMVDSVIIVLCTILWFQFGIAKKIKYFVMTAFGISFLYITYLDIEFFRILLVSISFPCIVLLITINKTMAQRFAYFDWSLALNYISILAVAIGVISTFLVVTHVINLQISLPTLNYVYYFFSILSIFSPVYLVLISFSYPFVLTLRFFRKKWERKSSNKQEDGIVMLKNVKRRSRVLHISLIIFLSIIVSMIPHVGTVNEDNQVIGSDTKNYMRFLGMMKESSTYDELVYTAFSTIMGGDRPFSLLLFFFLSALIYQGNYYSLLESLPILLSPLLVLSIYVLTIGLTRNHLTALLASLLTIPSHILIGIYAGLYANWFSLIWANLVILYLFKSINEPKKIHVLILSVLLIVLLFSHAQTWTILMYAIGLFLVVLFFSNRSDNKKIVMNIFLSILPAIIIEITKMLLIDRSGIKHEIAFALHKEVGIHGVYTIWDNLVGTTHLYMAGLVANPIILLLIIYWLYISKVKEKYTIFFIIFFSLLAPALLFADAEIQSRLFFEIPFQIPAAIALTMIKDRIGRYMPVAICLWLISMSVYMATNFVLVVPERFLS